MKWSVIVRLDCDGAGPGDARPAACAGPLYGAQRQSFDVARLALLSRAESEGWKVDRAASTASCPGCRSRAALPKYLKGGKRPAGKAVRA